MPSIYFDYNATTPLDTAVREVMLPFWSEIYGNPSSIHHIGRHARAALDDARDRVARVWQAKPSEVVFTSGGTESSNLALFGVARKLRSKGRHIITTSIEHHAVLHACEYLQKKEGFELTYLPVTEAGRMRLEDLERAFRPDTILVSIMAANNETGVLQPVAEAGLICRDRGVVFHTDAVQWFGKQPFTSIHQFNADLVSVCAHKFHGPKGVGALFVRSPLQPDPILFGGAHENERRAGTENIPAIIGLAEASERFVKAPVFPPKQLLRLTEQLRAAVEEIPGVRVRGQGDRLPNTVSFTVEGCDSIALLAALDMEGICASSGSACSVGSLDPSHVLIAMAVPRALANSFVRFSLGRESTAAETSHVLETLPKVIDQIRRGRLEPVGISSEHRVNRMGAV